MKNRLMSIILLLVIVIFFTGCTESVDNTVLLRVNTTEEIDAILETQPVFIEIGASRCPACNEQKPIIEELAKKYKDHIQFIYIDTDQQPQLARQFNVYYIPDMSLIVKSDNGTYIYMNRYGSLTDDRLKARMVGFTKKEVLEFTLDNALRLDE